MRQIQALFAAKFAFLSLALSPAVSAECQRADQFEIGDTSVTLANEALFYKSHMHADADGSARAYHSKYLRGPHDKTKPKNLIVQDTICNGASYYRDGKKIPAFANFEMCKVHYGRRCSAEERRKLSVGRCMSLVEDIKQAEKNDWRSPKINWFGVASKPIDGRAVPCIHQKGILKDYFVSQTSLPNDSTAAECSGNKYMDSETIPFIVLPSQVKKLRCEFKSHDVKKGDVVAVYSEDHEKLVFAIYADNGPAEKLGEGSLRLGWELRETPDGEKTDAESAVVGGTVRYLVFPGSATGAPYTFDGIQETGERLLKEWGGLTALLKLEN